MDVFLFNKMNLKEAVKSYNGNVPPNPNPISYREYTREM